MLLPPSKLNIEVVLFLRKPSTELVREFLNAQKNQPFSYSEVGASRGEAPPGYDADHHRLQLGSDEEAFRRARAALREWRMFAIPWITLCWPDAPIEVGATVALFARHAGLWSLNACRIVYLIEESDEPPALRLCLWHAASTWRAWRRALFCRIPSRRRLCLVRPRRVLSSADVGAFGLSLCSNALEAFCSRFYERHETSGRFSSFLNEMSHTKQFFYFFPISPLISNDMLILFVGDIVGSPGRRILKDHLADLVQQRKIDLAIVNCENAASGFGITPRLVDELFEAGADVLTGGNHIWDRKEIIDYFPHQPRLVRPANFPHGLPGSGLYVGQARNGISYAVLDLQGRTFMAPIDCPFRAAERELVRVPSETKVIIVDMHAETTSEKQAMGWFLDGKVSAVVGTHTHVATADAHVLPGGSAFITDVGMTGPHNSIIGMTKEPIIQRFLTALPARFEVAEGDVQLHAVVIEVDESSGRARSIEPLVVRSE